MQQSNKYSISLIKALLLKKKILINHCPSLCITKYNKAKPNSNLETLNVFWHSVLFKQSWQSSKEVCGF